MTRQLRLEYPGSLWHVMCRGNAKQDIFRDNADRTIYLDILGKAVDRFRWILPSYTLMDNHVHHVVQLRQETLGSGMKWLNAEYARAFNKRHGRVGHLYQDRYKAVLVERDTYYLELLRYVVLNPVRAGIVAKPEEYEWSSHRAVIGITGAPDWLAVDDALVPFGPDRDIARVRYRAFVHAGIGLDDQLWKNLVGQMYLGSEEWIESVRERVNLKPRADDYPREQLLLDIPMRYVIEAVVRVWSVPEEAVTRRRGSEPRMAAAWLARDQTLLTTREIAAGLRLRSASHVNALAKSFDQKLDGDSRLRRAIDLCTATLRRKNRHSRLRPP